MKKEYLKDLAELERLCDKTANTPHAMFAKVVALTVMNMRYERVAFDRRLKEHPYALTRRIVRDALAMFRATAETGFIESEDKTARGFKSQAKEEKHEELFNEIWDRYNEREYEEYIRRYERRVKVNALEPLIRGKTCVDLGCGNGNFLFALLRRGAGEVVGVDFGEKSVRFASAYARKKGLAGRARFKRATVYETGLPADAFDFAIQNGVFHHLDDEDRAIVEARRILKKGGWFWYYTDGEGGISYDLWDASVRMLRKVPAAFIEGVLDHMNVSRNKVAHLMDGLQATYAHTSWKKMTARLARLGFGAFKRLTGGFPTDFDADVVSADPYGKAKFGEGDLRILCRLERK